MSRQSFISQIQTVGPHPQPVFQMEQGEPKNYYCRVASNLPLLTAPAKPLKLHVP